MRASGSDLETKRAPIARGWWLRLTLALAAALMGPLPAPAVEYRLRVASLHEDAFYALLGVGGTRAEGPVTNSQLITALDNGTAPAGILLYDRPVEAATDAVAKAFRAVRIRTTLPQEGESPARWSEVRWDGTPGDQSVWVIGPSRIRYTEVRDVAVQGRGPLVRMLPHFRPSSGASAPVLGMWLGSIQQHEGDGGLWSRYLSSALDLSGGVAVVVGVNSSSGFADHVFIVVQHGAAPSTSHAVIAWRERPHETQAGGARDPGVPR